MSAPGQNPPRSLTRPKPWLCHLQRVPRRIAEIDRARAVRPVEIRLDFHPRRVQPCTPIVKRRALYREAEMPRPLCAMGRYRQVRVARWLAGLGWVEDQEHTAADAVEHVPIRHPNDPFEPEHLPIEPLRLIKIISV